MEIHPKQVTGFWDDGYVLDAHTISSTMIGYNEFGYAEFDTVRSELGELVYRLKYKGDRGVIPTITETVTEFVRNWGIQPTVVVPVPPSKTHVFQPVIEIATAIANTLKVPLDATSLKKIKNTAQMKDVGDLNARLAALQSAFASGKDLEGGSVLLFDDLFQSGATMNVVTQTIRKQGLAKAVYAIALTRTRN